MSQFSPTNRQLWKEQWERSPEKDPTAHAKRHGYAYKARRNKTGTLMPDDFMPIGDHAGKHLRAVPIDYLLWVDAQPWAEHWDGWLPVRDYISRFLTPDPETPPTEDVLSTPVIFVDHLRQHPPTTIRCFQAGSSHLHTLPGHEDRLHAFAIGALRLRQAWFQRGSGRTLPHYDLTVGKHALALKQGAQLIDDAQLLFHIRTWRTFQKSKPLHTEPSL